jgi:hypothetical protein
MATLIDAPEFTSNEVYQIQATDPVEGAASGASFSGIGVSNEPHQQLANRTAFLKQRQDVNISNIGVLQAFQALFSGLMAQNGYLKIPVADINKGLIQYIIQWGFVNWGSNESEGLYGPYSFPIAFPNACEIFMPVTLTPENPFSGEPGYASGDNVVMVSASCPPTASQFSVWNNNIAGTNAARGFYWLAIGF